MTTPIAKPTLSTITTPLTTTNNGNGGFTPRRMLVTGAAGFIGSHVLVRAMKGPLASTLIKLVALDRMDYCSVEPNPENLKIKGLRQPEFVFIRADVTQLEDMVQILLDHNIDSVIHLAALTHVDNSFGDNLHFTQDNVVGTHVLLEACRRTNWIVKRFLHVSTDEVYGESRPDHPFVESDALDPRNPYAATKAAAEAMVKSYYYSFKAPVVIARPNNVYGPRQFPEKVVPKFCRQLQRGLPITVHGDGNARRCFLFASDCAAALLEVCLVRGAIGDAYNVGGNHTVSVNELAEELANAYAEASRTPLQRKNVKVVHVEDRFANDRSYDLCSAKLMALGWIGPQTSWSVGIRETMAWYVSNPVFWENEDEAIVAHPRLVCLAARSSSCSVGGSPRMMNDSLRHHHNSLPSSPQSSAGPPTPRSSTASSSDPDHGNNGTRKKRSGGGGLPGRGEASL